MRAAGSAQARTPQALPLFSPGMLPRVMTVDFILVSEGIEVIATVRGWPDPCAGLLAIRRPRGCEST